MLKDMILPLLKLVVLQVIMKMCHFLFALKALERELGPDHVAYMLVTYLPVPSHIDEMKTKPTQQAIRLLGEAGILPDFIICRSQFPLDASSQKKN